MGRICYILAGIISIKWLMADSKDYLWLIAGLLFLGWILD